VNGDRLVALFEAYEAQGCPESRFVKACDRLDLALQAAAYADQGIDLSEFVASALDGLEEPTLRTLAGA
jgi:5'-deoxynucleotidase YfbR-like HD superfamily hydrolase